MCVCFIRSVSDTVFVILLLLKPIADHIHSSFIALMMEAVRTSETPVNFNVTTRRYIPEDSKLQTRRRENLKSHTKYGC
jgi:hypothetical protein